MKDIISASLARFRLGEPSHLRPYCSAYDQLTEKPLLARKVPAMEPVREALHFWSCTDLSVFLPLRRHFDYEGQILVLFDDPGKLEPLIEIKATSLGSTRLLKLFRDLAVALQFLSDQRIAYPRLDLNKLYWRDRGLLMIGVETLLPRQSQEMTCPDLRYTAPELAVGGGKTEKADIYQLGALFYHYLSESTYTPHGGYQPLVKVNARWGDHWDRILRDMLHPIPEQRIDWTTLWQRIFRHPAGRYLDPMKPVWMGADNLVFVDEMERQLGGDQPRAVGLQLYPGSERHGLLPFLYRSEQHGYLVLHSWRDSACNEAFRVINDFIYLLQEGVLPHLAHPNLTHQLKELTHWAGPSQTHHPPKQLIRTLLDELLPAPYKGILLVVEDVRNVDQGSLEALVVLARLLASVPLMLVFTCDNLAHDKFRFLKRKISLPWSFFSPPDLALPRAHKRLWFPGERDDSWLPDAIEETGGQELLLHHWINEHFHGGRELSHYLEHCWNCLTRAERQALKLLCFSAEGLSMEDLRLLMGPERPERPLQRLIRIGLVNQENERFAIRVPVLRRFCHELTSRGEQGQIHRDLMRHERSKEDPDPIRTVWLYHVQHQDSLAGRYLTLFDQAIFERFELGPLWALARLHRRSESDLFLPYYLLAQAIKGTSMGKVKSGPAPVAQLLHCLKHVPSDPDKVVRAFLKAASSPRMSQTMRGYCLLKACEFSDLQGDRISAGRSWRRFKALDTSELKQDVRTEWGLRFGAVLGQWGEMPTFDTFRNGSPMSLWYDARMAYTNGEFVRCQELLDEALPALRNHPDMNWRGQLFKLHGNALYRNNLPAGAIDAYNAAQDCFLQSRNETALSHTRFNQASVESLSGRFSASRCHFIPIYQQADREKDEALRCQTLYYLMVCDLFQNQVEHFREKLETFIRVSRRQKDKRDKIRVFTLVLIGALEHDKDLIHETMDRLEKLSRGLELEPMIACEVEVGMRLGRYALGLPDLSVETPYPEQTRWRHQFLDVLLGKGDQDLARLTGQMGSGYYGACHFYIVKTAIARGLLPNKLLTEVFFRAFQKHAKASEGNYSAFLARHFEHLCQLGDVPRKHWDEALSLFESLSLPPGDTCLTKVVANLAAIWSFNEWGILRWHGRQWVSLPDYTTPDSLLDHLAFLSLSNRTRPLTSSFTPVDQKSRGLLLIPLNREGYQHMAWFVSDNAAGYDLAYHYEPLLRFYARLMSLALGHQVEEVDDEATPRPMTEIVGHSPALQEIITKIQRFSPSDLNIYIWGESGTGKELVARAIHNNSLRADEPFSTLNCSNFPNTLVESELFGHVRGAFTGASDDRIGVLERTDGGTLFLDEIGDINEKVQSLLLRVVQQGEFTRLGETQIRRVDIRFVTATNKDLPHLIDQGIFREDLFYRLVEEEIRIPALRQRPEDLRLLVNHFATLHFPSRMVRFHADLLDLLRQYRWPGNVRELESYVRRMLIRWPRETELRAHHAVPFLSREGMNRESQEEETLDALVNAFKLRTIRQRLKHYEGNQTQTARSLGIARQTLHTMIHRYHLKD